MKQLTLQVEQETKRRITTQNELKVHAFEADNLKGSEKQLKQEMNTLLEAKRLLEFELVQLTKYVYFMSIDFPVITLYSFYILNIFSLVYMTMEYCSNFYRALWEV